MSSKVFTGLAQVFRDAEENAKKRAKQATPGSYDEGFWEGMYAGFAAAVDTTIQLAAKSGEFEEQEAKVIPLRRKEAVSHVVKEDKGRTDN
jgi:hypothetical protein